MTKQPESKLSHDIMEALRARDVFCFKIHGNETMMAGLPDIVACVPCHVDDWSMHTPGYFVGLETKMAGNDLSPKQRRVHDLIRQAHGEVFTVRSVEDALNVLRRIGWAEPPVPTRDAI